MNRNRIAIIITAVIVAAAAAIALITLTGEDRRREVAAKGRTVMPFDLDRTTHRFTKAGDGECRPSPPTIPPTPRRSA
nr:hypothetical protein GCM10020093_009750 [Planobispora longispora]